LIEAAATLLRSEFDVIATAGDGPSLVSHALRLHPDVIVADVTMPRFSGIEAARQLRKAGCSAKLVFLTVHSEEEFIDACVEIGAMGYVLKSDMKVHLVAAVRAALARRLYIPAGYSS
jgi:DNA-binding NarL/FixJ family response regulator